MHATWCSLYFLHLPLYFSSKILWSFTSSMLQFRQHTILLK
jgi:hypothetical protein